MSKRALGDERSGLLLIFKIAVIHGSGFKLNVKYKNQRSLTGNQGLGLSDTGGLPITLGIPVHALNASAWSDLFITVFS